MNYHFYFAGVGMALLAPLLTSCEQKGPSKTLQAEVVNALEDVEDKASADEAAQLIDEAYREYKKEKIDMELNQKRLHELREQISEKKYYYSEALRMVL
ncbi:MAG: hypothetical protein LIO63_06725 [Akkermansia sp.]|nr:hypothetical protein [Akkermansia sp.]MCC8021650.1 hypothetical protein [Akkermansia sp.]